MNAFLFLALLLIGVAAFISAWRYSPWAAAGLVMFWVWCLVGGEFLGALIGIW